MTTMAIAEPSGQSPDSRNCWAMRLPASNVLLPPRITGIVFSPVSGMKTSSEPARTPGSASGNVIRRKARQGGSPRVLRSVDERPVDPLERRVGAGHHQRQVVVGDADVDGVRREEDLVALHEPGQAERPEDRELGVEDDEPPRKARIRKLVQKGTMTSRRSNVLCRA